MELMPQGEINQELGQQIIPLVAGEEPGKSTGLTFYFTQRQLQHILECERQTQLALIGRFETQAHPSTAPEADM